MSFGKQTCQPKTDLIHFLYSLSWNMPSGPAFSQKEMSQMNLDFDERGCLGRAIKAAVLAEKYFPHETIFYGEVLEDFFRNLMITNARPQNWQDESYLEEIIQYEEPHAVIMWGDYQFDALFKLIHPYPENLKHPKVGKREVWPALYSSYLISHANSALEVYKNTGNLEEYRRVIQEAKNACPELSLVQEHQAILFFLLDRLDEAQKIAVKISEQRKDAKTLFFLWTITQDQFYQRKIAAEYGPNMFYYLKSLFL